jgi:hypothetical protein
MGQQHVQNENFNTERQAVLTGLNAQIDGLDMKIADLMAERYILERARNTFCLYATPHQTAQTTTLLKQTQVTHST